MPRNKSRKYSHEAQDAVDWTAIPDQVICALADYLQQRDLKLASLVCTSWRHALRGLVLRKLCVYVSHVIDVTSRTRGRKDANTRDLQRLVERIAPHAAVSLIVSDLRLPSPAQIESALKAVRKQQHIRELSIQVLQQAAPLGPQAAGSFVKQALSILAGSEHHISSLKLATEALQLQHLAAVSYSLSQLPSLHQLTYSCPDLRPSHITTLTTLSNLTTLSLTWTTEHPIDHSTSTTSGANTLQDLLQQLSALRALQALTLAGPLPAAAPAQPVLLPAWPQLTQLRLDYSCRSLYMLQLSGEHCAQLEALAACCFQAAEGVSRMERLRSLQLAHVPTPTVQHQHHQHLELAHAPTPAAQQQVPAQPQHQQHQQHQAAAHQHQHQAPPQQGPPQPQHTAQQCHQVSYPALQALTVGHRHVEDSSPLAVAAMLAAAPQLAALDLHHQRRYSPGTARHEQQALAQALARLEPLRSLSLPFYESWMDVAGDTGSWLLQPAARRGQLARLSLRHPLHQSQWRLLAACASLQELQLRGNREAVLAYLPAGLTALTTLHCMSLQQEGGPSAGPLRAMPPLHRLCVLGAGATQALQVLRLWQLTRLTHLSTTLPAGEAVASVLGMLPGLAELRCGVWRGATEHLASLKQLTGLTLLLGYTGLPLLEQQISGLCGLTGLRKLVLGAGGAQHRRQEVVRRLSAALPHCLVTLDNSDNDFA